MEQGEGNNMEVQEPKEDCLERDMKLLDHKTKNKASEKTRHDLTGNHHVGISPAENGGHISILLRDIPE